MAVITDSGSRGVVTDLAIHAAGSESIATVTTDAVNVTYAGIEGDSHTGLTRQSCVRVKRQYKMGTQIRNTRQISIVSEEELRAIAALLDIPLIKPEWLGSNICLSGIADFTRIPPATRLLFSDGAALVVDVENEPCKYPADIIDQHHPGAGKLFVKHAMGRRGVTAWVEREGEIKSGSTVEVHVPTLHRWAP